MYRNISMIQRLDRIGELLAKGIYLCLKEDQEKNKNDKESSEENEQNKMTGIKE
jgi:Holliday junction resolvasome RuvABC DNA-binding subunit